MPRLTHADCHKYLISEGIKHPVTMILSLREVLQTNIQKKTKETKQALTKIL